LDTVTLAQSGQPVNPLVKVDVSAHTGGMAGGWRLTTRKIGV